MTAAAFTVFATGRTDRPLAEIEETVRAALDSAGVVLIRCGWAPDADTIAEYSDVTTDETIALLDINGPVENYDITDPAEREQILSRLQYSEGQYPTATFTDQYGDER